MAKRVLAAWDADELLDESASASSTLSVCCLTSGRSPARLAAILRLLRPVADEIVVALDEAERESAPLLAGVADRILLFSTAEPGDRPLAWLCRSCRMDWILNIDDDEVPSASLVRALSVLVRRTDVTHCWIARRWLYPGIATYLDVPPWNAEYQLRLFLSDERFLRFSDQFHRPIECRGPMRFVSSPLWHLDTALTSREDRERKALRYEHERRGMRIGGLSHNTGLYLPELRVDAAVQPVPPRELRRIEGVVQSRSRRGGAALLEEPVPSSVDRDWPGAPHPATLYQSSLTLLAGASSLTALVQQTMDVRVKNLGSEVWRSGEDSITIGTRWDGAIEGLRTSLPADVEPGESCVVPVHVLPPGDVGHHLLEVDLVHEHVRWFGRPLRVEVDVSRRRRVLVAGDVTELDTVLDSIALVPQIEPLVVLEPEDVGPGLPRIDGLGRHLFGSAGTDGWRALPRALGVLLRSRRRASAHPFLQALPEAECLILVGDDVRAGSPPTRDRLRTLTMVGAARARGVPVWRVGVGRPSGSVVDRVLQFAIGAGALAVTLESLLSLLSQT